MVLAIWGGIAGAPILINIWVLIGLLAASVLASILRLVRRGSLVSLRGSPILAVWLATRFMLAPAFILIGVGWLACWALGFAAADPLEDALFLLLFYGGPAIFITSAVTDIAAAIKGPRTGSTAKS
jgi:hypothetical protein